MPDEPRTLVGGHPIVALLPDGGIAIDCAFCEGKASFPPSWNEGDDIPTEPCSVCSGTGINVIPATAESVHMCRLCRGSGQATDENGYFAGETCPVCGGRGVVDIAAVARVHSEAHPHWSLLHPEIVTIARPRFDAAQFADAVEAAFKHFNRAVQRRVRSIVETDADGAGLMTEAFSVRDPILILADLHSRTGKDIQQGYMQMFAGAMTGIRNPKAHDNITIDAQRAMHFLYVASLFMSKLDEAVPHPLRGTR